MHRYHTRPSSLSQVQVELKKGQTIMIDVALHLPAACLHETFSNRSGLPPDHFELYYRGKRLEGAGALSSWGIEKDSAIEVKMRGRGGAPDTSPDSGELGTRWLAAKSGGAIAGSSGTDSDDMRDGFGNGAQATAEAQATAKVTAVGRSAEEHTHAPLTPEVHMLRPRSILRARVCPLRPCNSSRSSTSKSSSGRSSRRTFGLGAATGSSHNPTTTACRSGRISRSVSAAASHPCSAVTRPSRSFGTGSGRSASSRTVGCYLGKQTRQESASAF